MGNFIIGILVTVGVLAYVGNQDRDNHAIGDIVAIHNLADTGVIEGVPDFGVRVKTTVKNVGKDGFIRVKAKLSSSEGEWEREQTLHFYAGESRVLNWFFHEPTINVSNVESLVIVTPDVQEERGIPRKEA